MAERTEGSSKAIGKVPRRISEEGLGAFLSKVYCFLVAEASTLFTLAGFRTRRKFTFQLPGPFNERYFPDGRLWMNYTNLVPKACCEFCEQSYVLRRWRGWVGRADKFMAERTEGSSKAIGNKIQQLCDLAVAGTHRVNLEPPLLLSGRHPQGKPRATSVQWQSD